MKVGIPGTVGIALLVGTLAFGWWLSVISSPSLSSDTEVVMDAGVFEARRLPGNPILRHTMDPRLVEEAQAYGYVNINGPSLIRVPTWIEHPLGRYYLYFAHHKGEYIRLSYADRLEGLLRGIWAKNASLDRARVHRGGKVLVVVWNDAVLACWEAVNAVVAERLVAP